MDDPSRPTRLQPAASVTNSKLMPLLHSFVPPYFLERGPIRGVCYALGSLTGLLSWAIVLIAGGLDWLIDGVDILGSVPSWVGLSIGFWVVVSYFWMALMYREHHDGTRGWRVYIFGGGWAWGLANSY